MINIELDYNLTKQKLIDFLSNRTNVLMTLSTSANNIVLSRTVWIENKNLDLYFFTWAFSRKCSQISLNPNVSLCHDKIEIEGTTHLIGPMFSTETERILQLFINKDAESIKQWECKPSMVIYQITPLFACVDIYKDNNEVFYEYINFKNKTAYKENWANK